HPPAEADRAPRTDPDRAMTRALRFGVVAIAVAALITFPYWSAGWESSRFATTVLRDVLVFAIFALSLDLLIGRAGMPSLGHAAFFGAGAYAAGIASQRLGTDQLPITMGAAILVATALALVIGALVVRSAGIFFLMLTLALAQFRLRSGRRDRDVGSRLRDGPHRWGGEPLRSGARRGRRHVHRTRPLVRDPGRRDGAGPRLRGLRAARATGHRRRRARRVGEGAALIEIRDLVRTFGGVRALDGVSIAVAAGERRAVIGPNGAGKTTLINVITGEIPPTAGVVRIAGEDVTMLRPWQRARKGLARMYQRNELFPPLAARDNVALALAVKAGPYRPLERVPSTQPRAA